MTVELAQARQELEGALRSNTELQERIAAADGRLATASLDLRKLEARLSETSARGAALEKSLRRAEAGRAAAAAAAASYRDRLEEAAAEVARLKERLAASEAEAAAVGESLAEASAGRGAADARADRLQSEADGVAEECAALREEGRATAARCEEAEAAREGLERRVGELGCEVRVCVCVRGGCVTGCRSLVTAVFLLCCLFFARERTPARRKKTRV